MSLKCEGNGSEVVHESVVICVPDIPQTLAFRKYSKSSVFQGEEREREKRSQYEA